jgi:hypothetical protein
MNKLVIYDEHIIHMISYINNTIKTCLHKYNHYYDSIQTNIDINKPIKKNNDIILLLNNKSFHFINEINITFKNDFDNKIYFNNLPHELNLEIYSYLIDKNSFKINLFNLECLFIEKIKYYICKDEIEINIKFKLIDKYFNKINEYNDIEEFKNQIPNYLLNQFKYGIIIQSLVNRNLYITIKNTIYNNKDFYGYKYKFIETIQSITI